MKNWKMANVLLLILTLILFSSVPLQAAGENKDALTQEEFLGRLIKAAGIKASGNTESITETAQEAGIVKEGEGGGPDSRITKEQAAVFVNRVDILLHGKKYNEQLCKALAQKNRISDIEKAAPGSRNDIIMVYGKGIMMGTFNGMFEPNRTFGVKKSVTENETDVIISRLQYPEKRKKLSPDGQLIRTAKLPRNYKDYPYILANYPNSFYEAPFSYQRNRYYGKPTELKEFTRPANMRKRMFDSKRGLAMKDIMDIFLDQWCEKIEKNIKQRFNVDYRTVGNKWISELRSTYYIYNDSSDKKRTDDIKAYVKQVKKNKVIIKASEVIVEPSTLYDNGGPTIRVYVKFKVDSGTVASDKNGMADLTNLIYSELAYVKNFKAGSWNEKYFDIELGTGSFGSDGSDYAIFGNFLTDAQRKIVFTARSKEMDTFTISRSHQILRHKKL